MEAARQGAALMYGNLVAPLLVARDYEAGFALTEKTGGQVRVRIRPQLDSYLDEVTRGKKQLEKSDNQQRHATVDATNYVHVLQELPTGEATFDLKNFVFEIVSPAVESIAAQTDAFFVRRICGGVAAGLSGTPGSSAVTIKDIVEARKVMVDAGIPQGNWNGIIGSTVEANFLQLDQFTNRDYGEQRAFAIQEAMLQRLHGIDWYMDQRAGGDLVQGDIAGTVTATGTAGTFSLALAAFTAASGTIRSGTRFTVAGDTTVYNVVRDAAISSNAATVEVWPKLATSPSAAAVTFESAPKQDVIFHRDMVAGVIVTPPPMRGTMSAVGTYNGVNVRLSVDSTLTGTSGAADNILVDCFIGCDVIRPEGGVLMQATGS